MKINPYIETIEITSSILKKTEYVLKKSSLQALAELYIDQITAYAEENQTCLRKAVGCGVVQVGEWMTLIKGRENEPDYEDYFVTFPLIRGMTHNGPSSYGNPCSNEVGNCGCMHAEQKAIIDIYSKWSHLQSMRNILFCTYSPCSTCANMISYSKAFQAVVYKIDTAHDMRGINILRNGGIKVIRLDEITNDNNVTFFNSIGCNIRI